MKGVCMNRLRIVVVLVAVMIPARSAAEYLLSNFNRPYDRMYMIDEWPNSNGKPSLLSFFQTIEYGLDATGRDRRGNQVCPFSIFAPAESSIAMLMGLPCGHCCEPLLNELSASNAMLTDDGCRGRFKVTGDYHEWDYVLHNRLNFAIPNISGRFFFTVHVPVKHRACTNICWNDQTQLRTLSDFLVRDNIACPLASLALCQGNLNLCSKSKTGIGDVVFELGWYQDFPQQRENLQNARITLRAGLSAPTAAARDENFVFDLPLGYDGAWAIPASLAIDLNMNYSFMTGIEFEILKIFDHIKDRRLKTARCQTDFLLLDVASARKQCSISWKFDVYAGFEHVVDGFSAFMRYQFVKADEDYLHVQCTNQFNEQVVNSAQYLDDWIYQNLIFQLNYDFFKLAKNSIIKPQCMFFYKIPLSGRRVIMAHTIGGGIAFSF